MKKIILLLIVGLFISCESQPKTDMKRIIFLHHSTGNAIWIGNTNKYIYKLFKKGDVQWNFDSYNRKNKTYYKINDQIFPKTLPYGWNNYPFDYYNIWVKNAGPEPYLEEPTLEILTKVYDVIILKHCFPVSNINADQAVSSVDSDYKSITNYKLQYNALKAKFHQFQNVKFILWTGAALVRSQVSEPEAIRAKEFFSWVIHDWDVPGDNIFIWDFYTLQTNGGLYFPVENAVGENDSHPNRKFARIASRLFCNRIIDVIENEGSGTSLTGEKL